MVKNEVLTDPGSEGWLGLIQAIHQGLVNPEFQSPAVQIEGFFNVLITHLAKYNYSLFTQELPKGGHSFTSAQNFWVYLGADNDDGGMKI